MHQLQHEPEKERYFDNILATERSYHEKGDGRVQEVTASCWRKAGRSGRSCGRRASI
jgi:hypothetical protein